MKWKCRAYALINETVKNSNIILIKKVVPYNVKRSELRFEAWKRVNNFAGKEVKMRNKINIDYLQIWSISDKSWTVDTYP